ncbi:MAG: hypothetical protein Q9209_005327 [Squamulea sp. 1 TL-2023]
MNIPSIALAEVSPFYSRILGVQRSTKTKTVRIISPQYSRSKDSYGIADITSPPAQALAGSPNAPSPAEELSSIDPFGAQSDEGTSQDDDEDLRRNTIANTVPIMSQNLPPDPSTRAPALQFGGDASTIYTHGEFNRPASTACTGRPHYDVDDFKRLLLTGERLGTDRKMPTTPPVQVHGLQLGDSNSNTDASSVSRQSIFEPHPEAVSESPRTSIDASPSDDERHGLVQPSSSPNVGRSRPYVPPSRHGKLVKQNMPQTVSFESLSSSSPDHSTTLISSTKPLSPSSPKDTTDLNKPLPPPPKVEFSTPIQRMPDASDTGADEIETPSTQPHNPGRVAARRSPPALPTARRHGKGRSRSSTNDSDRSASLSEDFSQHTVPSSSSSSIIASKPPPLPPPRRAGTAPSQDNTGLVANAESGMLSTESTPFKSRPPAPPSRNPSTTSIKRISRISTASGFSGAVVPPPPPAPRRRGSSQSSMNFTPSRLSGEYRFPSNERSRGDSGASSTQQPITAENHANGKDLVADLAALQKEVDELRGKFGR